MQQVGLQTPPDADDIPDLDDIFVGFEVVIGAVVDFGDGLGHDVHHGFDTFNVVEFLKLRIGVVGVDGAPQRQVRLRLALLLPGCFGRIEYALLVLYPISKFS